MSLFAGQERKAEITGAIVLVAVAITVGFTVFLSGRVHLGRHVRVEIDFDQIGGLGEGAAVMVAGRQVGTVDAIALVPAVGLPATDPLAGAGGVAVWVRIAERDRDMVPVNGEVFVSSRGLLSERYLEIGPPPRGAAPGRPVADGDRLRGSSPPTLDRALQRTWDNLERTRAFVAEVGPDARALFANLRALMATMAELDPDGGWAALGLKWQAALATGEAAWATLRDAGGDPAHAQALAASVADVMATARRSVALLRGRAEALLAALDATRARIAADAPAIDRLRAALARVDALGARVDHALAQAQALAAAFARGEGTIAKLGSDPEFPEDAKELGKILKRHPWRVIAHPPPDDAP